MASSSAFSKYFSNFHLSIRLHRADPSWRMSTKITCSSSSWSKEQDKAFEIGVAVYPEDSVDRWGKIAAMVAGKTVSDIKHHYSILEKDINAIDSGYVPLPHYVSSFEDSAHHSGNSGVLSLLGNSDVVNHSHNSDVVKGGSQGRQMQINFSDGGKLSQSNWDQNKAKPWTEEEHW